jgi:3-oxoadipate enol-lactonase
MVGTSAEGYRAALQRLIALYHEEGPEIAIHTMISARWPAYTESLDRVMPGAFDQAVRDAAATFDSELPALLEWRFGEGEASQIAQPTLSVLGEASLQLSPRFGESHEWLLSHLPSAQGHVMPKTHHFLQMEDPAGLAAAIAPFLSRHPMSTEAA